jgi:coenzyme F420 hydrogenase subunit beta
LDDPKSAAIRDRYHALLDEDEDPGDWAYAWRAELNRGGFRAVDFLMREIVDTGKCVGCAACVTICPTDVFDYIDEQPVDTRTDACVQCVLCADVCPVLRPPDPDQPATLQFREPLQDDGYGLYNYELFARSTRQEVVDATQDGGVVSALLVHQLELGEIEGAILGDIEPDNPQIGFQRLARTAEEIMACAGSRYTFSPNTLALKEAMEQGVAPIAVVGVPCQVNGVRQQQHSTIRMEINRWYRTNIPLVIGLFCSEAFTHESVEALGERFDVAPSAIENINIKGKVIVRIDGQETQTLSLKQFRKYARPACLYCTDYAADLADIGVGGIGRDDWTYVVVRTEAGHKALQACIDAGRLETAEVSDFPKSKALLARLSQEKANRPLPALMPTLQEREATGDLDPKEFGKKLGETRR